MSDALAKVKKDLGKDAVILQTRTLRRGGVFGVGARARVEITATVDEKVLAYRKSAPRLERAGPSPAPALPASRAVPGPGALRPASKDAESPAVPQRWAENPCLTENPRWAENPFSVPDPALQNEIVKIRQMVRNLLRQADRAKHPNVPADLIDYYTSLVSQSVADELAVDVLNRVARKLQDRTTQSADPAPGDHPPLAESPDDVFAALQQTLADMLPPAEPLRLTAAGRPTVVALVGPTGVGKTTTIAKLAANMKLREHKKVGLLTIDSYRIAAVEQLRTYANILKVPLVSVLTPADMQPALQTMADRDLVLIDTAGRSQKDDLRIAELNQFIQAADPDQVHLVLSTTSAEQTNRQAIEKFAQLGARSLIFTKIDEALGFGVILNVLKTVNMKLSYLTTGQSVPDDIEVASATRVAKLILDAFPANPADNESQTDLSPTTAAPHPRLAATQRGALDAPQAPTRLPQHPATQKKAAP